MAGRFQRILYGGDYNPNQWPEEVWKEDMRMFRKAGINSATINVFSWAKLQPSEETYYFDELDKIVDMLSAEEDDIVMATSTGALPAWMVKRYPEVSRTDYEGRHHKFGQRHNACPNSQVYRKFMVSLTAKLAERYAHNPHITCWHINNEYGGECYCENCEKAFRVWLKKKYKTIEAVNKAWNTEFWGHTFYDFDEIVLPNVLGDGIGTEDTAFAGLSIDYKRFNSDSLLENYCMERDAIRAVNPDALVTTNLMGTYKGLDYFKWAKEMDIVSWDNYPALDTPWSFTAMTHDLMRGLKKEPFMLMEQTPSQQNWQKYNSLKRPGQMRAQSYQTLAHGADTIQFFQLRRSVGGCEKFHGAVIAHAGTENTRVFREVSQLGEELARLGRHILGTENRAEVAMIFDWDNYWGLEYTSGPSEDLKYVDQIHQYYRYFYEHNIPVDMVSAEDTFAGYKVVAAPVLYMVKEGMKEALTAFVKQGGILILTYMSGIVDQSDNVYLGGYPGPLRELAGVWVEEIDALFPDQKNQMIFADGREAECGLVCDIMHLEGAEALAVYGSDFYKDSPVVTRNTYGAGRTYYIGSDPSEEGIEMILDKVREEAGISGASGEKARLEIVSRWNGEQEYGFLMNFTDQVLPVPERFAGKEDLLTEKAVESGETMKKYDVKIVKM